MGVKGEDDWDRMNRLRAHDAFRAFKTREIQEWREGREKQTLTDRLYEVIRLLQTVSYANVRSLEQSSATADSLHLPFVDDGIGHLEPRETRQFIRDLSSKDVGTVFAAVVALENAFDTHRGVGRFEANRSGDEIDARILQEYAGFSAEEVHAIEPSLGPTKAIKQTRIKADRDPDNGYLVDEAVAA